MWGLSTVTGAAVALALVGCGSTAGGITEAPPSRTAAPTAGGTTAAAPTAAPQVVTTPPTAAAPVPPPTAPAALDIPLRLERRVDDDATADFAAVVAAALHDGRGWTRAGFTFTFRDDAPFTIVLAEGPEVDALCAPYDTGGRFSCQLGPVVALNADRWRTATAQWTGGLGAYRQMLVNHEVGHLLGQHHPTGGCTTPGAPAPVMIQQSTDLGGCLANPWPLDWEVACARARLEPLAPPHEETPTPVCGPQGPRGDG